MEEQLQRSSWSKDTVGHEERDADVRPIVLTGVGLAVILVLVGGIVYGVLRYLQSHPATAVQSSPMAVLDPQIPPAPRIEEHPAIEIQQLRAQEEQTLSTYGWMDKRKGVVRIPLDRAMQLQMERGFPRRKEPVQR